MCEAPYRKLFLVSSNNGLNEDVLVPGHVVHPSAGQAAPDNSLSLNFGGVRQLQIWFYTISILSQQRYRLLSVSNGYEEIVSCKYQACGVRSLPLISTERQVATRNSTLLDLLSRQKRI